MMSDMFSPTKKTDVAEEDEEDEKDSSNLSEVVNEFTPDVQKPIKLSIGDRVSVKSVSEYLKNLEVISELIDSLLDLLNLKEIIGLVVRQKCDRKHSRLVPVKMPERADEYITQRQRLVTDTISRKRFGELDCGFGGSTNALPSAHQSYRNGTRKLSQQIRLFVCLVGSVQATSS